MTIQNNIIHGAHLAGVEDLLFLGSSYIYPKLATQPMNESALLTGTLEETNEPYAIAKMAGIKMCESYNRQYNRNYRSVMPTNLYGMNDNFHPQNSHVIPALLRRFHEAKLENKTEVVAWGTGKPMREFLHVDDMAAASVFVMSLDRQTYNANTQPMLSHINVGTGVDCTIRELVETVAKVVGFEGDIVFDTSKLDGSPGKLMDVSRLADLGWRYSIDLESGLAQTYAWFLENQESFRGYTGKSIDSFKLSIYLTQAEGRELIGFYLCRNSTKRQPIDIEQYIDGIGKPLMSSRTGQYLDKNIFTTVISSTSLVSIDLVVINERNQVLLGKRLNRPAKGFWFVPGDRIYKNERIEEAFLRITQLNLVERFRYHKPN